MVATIPSLSGQWSKAEDTILYLSFSITPSLCAPEGRAATREEAT